MNRTRTLLVLGVFMLSLAVLAALEFRVQDEAPTEGQMVTGSLSKDVPALPKLPSLTRTARACSSLWTTERCGTAVRRLT